MMMHSLRKPGIDFLDLFHRCLGQKKPTDENLKNKFTLINFAAKEYESKANDRELYKLNPMAKEELDPVTPDNIGAVFWTQKKVF